MIIIGLDYGIRHIAVAYINTQPKDKTLPTFDIVYRYLVDNNDVKIAFHYVKLLTAFINKKALIIYEKIDEFFNPNASKMSGKTVELYALLNDYFTKKGSSYAVLKLSSIVTKSWAKTSFFINFRKKIKLYTNQDKLPNAHATDAINMALFGYQQILLKYVTLDNDLIDVSDVKL